MRTVTIRINDSYFDRFMGFLELLPKKTIIIEEDKKQKELDTVKADLKEAFEDVKLGRTIKTNKTITLQS